MLKSMLKTIKPFTISLPTNTLKFILLNLYGHDIWHDFGNLLKTWLTELQLQKGNEDNITELLKEFTQNAVELHIKATGGGYFQTSRVFSKSKQKKGLYGGTKSSLKNKKSSLPSLNKILAHQTHSIRIPPKGSTPATVKRVKSNKQNLIEKKNSKTARELRQEARNRFAKLSPIKEISNLTKKQIVHIIEMRGKNQKFMKVIRKLRDNIFQLILYILGFIPETKQVNLDTINTAFDTALEVAANSPIPIYAGKYVYYKKSGENSVVYRFIEHIQGKIKEGNGGLGYLKSLSQKKSNKMPIT